MTSPILHITGIYSAIILMVAGVLQYSHHHHHFFENNDGREIVFMSSAQCCHDEPPAHDESSPSHCALHLAQMMVRQEMVLAAGFIQSMPLGTLTYDADTITPRTISLFKAICHCFHTVLHSKIFNDYAFSRGSPRFLAI